VFAVLDGMVAGREFAGMVRMAQDIATPVALLDSC